MDERTQKNEDKKAQEEQSQFRKLVIDGLKKTEEDMRTRKDNRFKDNQQKIKDSNLLTSGNAITANVASNLLEISENANKQSASELTMQQKHLKVLEKTLKGVTDPNEKQKLQDLLDLTRENVKISSGLSTKIADGVGKSLVAATAITAGILSDSPILALGVAFMGQSIKDNLQARRERKDEIADQTEALRTSIEEGGDMEDVTEAFDSKEFAEGVTDGMRDELDLYTNEQAEKINESFIERINALGATEEEKREAAVIRDAEMSLLERQTEALENLLLNNGEDGDDGVGLGGALTLGAAGLAAGLLTSIGGAMTAFGLGLKTFVLKTLPAFLLKLNPIVLIAGTMMSGIDDAFKAYMETGNISNAIAAGLGGVIDFLTFGLIDKETIENLLNPAFDMMKKVFGAPMETLTALWDNVSTFLDDINTGIADAFEINPKEMLMELHQKMIGNFVEMFEWIATIPDMLMDSIKNIGGGLMDSASDFFSDMNPFNVEVEPAFADANLQPVPTSRQEPILKTLIEDSEKAKTEMETAKSAGQESTGDTLVSAPTTNNQVSNKIVYNNLNASNGRRITTH